MVSSREDFLTNLLNCGSLDLRLIDDVGYNWCDILDSETLGEMLSDLSGRREPLNYIMRRVIEFGIDQIATAVADRICELRTISNERELDADEAKELDALCVLNPEEDIVGYHNYIDTHVWFENNANTYHTYLQEDLDDFADGTGFEIGGD